MTDTPKPSLSAVLEYYGADLSHVSERGWRKMRCPFHDDSRPSASVNLEAGEFACHACGMTGDSWGLIMQNEGLRFKEAVEWSGSRFGEQDRSVQRPAKKNYTPSWDS